MTRRLAPVAIAAVALLAVAACSQSQEEQFREATERLEEAQAGLDAARERVERKEQKVAAARKELATAREATAEAEERVGAARSRVREVANDEVLFRAVQTRLLTELDDVAVDADVRDGVVTLTGQVPDESVREEAADLARSVPGVVDVRNRLRTPVQKPAAPPEPAAAPKDAPTATP